MYDYDILIVGGGPVGCALAQALRDTSLRLAMCELKQPDLTRQAEADARSIALSCRSQRIFEQLSVWPFLRDFVAPIKFVHVSEQGQFGMTRIDHQQEGVPALGYVIELTDLLSGLDQALVDHPSLTRYFDCQIEVAEPYQQGMRVRGRLHGQPIDWTTRLLVVANGGQSPLAKQLGFSYKQHDYQQSALVVNVGLDRSLKAWAYERFTTEGPLACLPLRRHSAAMVWTVARERLAELLALSEDAFRSALQAAFGYRAGAFTWIGPRQGFPLVLTVQPQQVCQGAIVLGNAAHSLHPVAGQGFNLSLRDVQVLSRQLRQALSAGRDFAGLEVLSAYQQTARLDQERTIAYTHSLVKTFSNANPIFSVARNAALLALDWLPVCKHLLAAHNMGFSQPFCQRTSPAEAYD